MNWYLILYIFVSIITGTGPTYWLFFGGRTIAALIYLILSILVLVFYGLRWFQYGDLNATGAAATGSWPPIINTCPDYLTYFSRPGVGGSPATDTCIDLVGVSRNGGLTMWSKQFSASNPPTDDKYYFNLATTAQDPAGKMAELCQNAMTSGLSWEGICTGDACYTPPTAISGSTASASSSCPSPSGN